LHRVDTPEEDVAVPAPRSYGTSLKMSRTKGELPLDELPPARRPSHAPVPSKTKPPIETFLSLCRIAESEALKGNVDDALRRRLSEARSTALRAAGASPKKRRRVEDADADLRALLARVRPRPARTTRRASPVTQRTGRSTMDGGLVPEWERRKTW
jgi:hypothetical protein